MEPGKLGSLRTPWFHPEWGYAETGAILGGLTIYLVILDTVKVQFEEAEARANANG